MAEDHDVSCTFAAVVQNKFDTLMVLHDKWLCKHATCPTPLRSTVITEHLHRNMCVWAPWSAFVVLSWLPFQNVSGHIKLCVSECVFACLSQRWREGVNHSSRNHPCRRSVSTHDKAPKALIFRSLTHTIYPALPLLLPPLSLPSYSRSLSVSLPRFVSCPGTAINFSSSKSVMKKKARWRVRQS